jgi:3-phenylpropionate/trans-cinnamate dioxygenase ferredoxin reductase subunit
VIVGAGFVGLEVATSALALGAHVTVVEPCAAPLERALGARVGDRLGAWARDAGVHLRLGSTVRSLDRRSGRLRAAVLGDRTSLPCDVVVVGVGTLPNTELVGGQLALAPDGGIPTDAAGRTALEGVYACGDVASIARGPGRIRLEHWSAAASSARGVAHAVLGLPAPPPDTPFFWSDQLGRRLQAVGLPAGDLEVELDDGGETLAARYRDPQGRLRGAVVVDRPEQLATLRGELREDEERAAGPRQRRRPREVAPRALGRELDPPAVAELGREAELRIVPPGVEQQQEAARVAHRRAVV